MTGRAGKSPGSDRGNLWRLRGRGDEIPECQVLDAVGRACRTGLGALARTREIARNFYIWSPKGVTEDQCERSDPPRFSDGCPVSPSG